MSEISKAKKEQAKQIYQFNVAEISKNILNRRLKNKQPIIEK